MNRLVLDTDIASYLFREIELRIAAEAFNGWDKCITRSRACGHKISAQDARIAATGLALDASLATNNRRDYEHIPGLELLALQAVSVA